ncbi:hypothetical protein Mapa_009127 [Marchantia paleacea]|nr:hypothetical protein Mapa_009127 [Marchantia paleacea]
MALTQNRRECSCNVTGRAMRVCAIRQPGMKNKMELFVSESMGKLPQADEFAGPFNPQLEHRRVATHYPTLWL